MRERILALRQIRCRGQHPGLLLQRYLAHAADGSEAWSNEKRQLLMDANESAKNTDLQTIHKAAFERWRKSEPPRTLASQFQTEGRLIVGLGSENVLETGIRLHHTYGLPMIPGSALKGLAAHYCHEVWGHSDESFRRPTPTEDEAYRKFLANKGPAPKANCFRLLFGTTDDSGCITFHDAWLTPDSANPLVLDVMTPHHPKWLDGVVPTDFDSPVPVPFVSVAGAFRVAVSWNGPDTPKAEGWIERAFELLAGALREWGVGGKTSSGYGRLTETDPGKRENRYRIAALGLPAPGDVVEGTLLDPPKRNKPWRAKIALRNAEERSGPVEPADAAPANVKSGQVVRLVVTHVDEKSIRFAWPK